MATTLETVAQNAACDAVVDLLDGGTIELQEAGGTVIGTLTFGTPAFGAASAGVATANAISDETSTASGGPITQAVCKASGGGTVFTADVTINGGGGAVQLTSVNYNSGETISITSLTHTQPAS